MLLIDLVQQMFQQLLTDAKVFFYETSIYLRLIDLCLMRHNKFINICSTLPWK